MATAFHRTRAFFGWRPLTLVLPLFYGGGFVAFWVLQGKDAAMYELGASAAFGFAPVAAYSLLVFAYHLITTPALLRRERARAGLQADVQRSADDSLKNWLKSTLANPKLGIDHACLFGSIVQERVTRDVDVLVVLSPAAEKDIRRRVEALQRLARDFDDTFRHQVHYQFFLATQHEEIQRFLDKAGAAEILFRKV